MTAHRYAISSRQNSRCPTAPLDKLNCDNGELVRAWNARNHPGTRQLCAICGDATGRCEDDALHIDADEDPVCEACWLLFSEDAK